ncbi:LPS-assembly protein LptD [Stutzerimonas tarimensis]|uniref:LPS-assembly protein LptD n=1 Tax=Stutzerimonas tarimensis TaxID=1507735 RepID=A0ABV7T967_9GAMM
MAVKHPSFHQKFPLLFTGSLLALQPMAASLATAAEQFACEVGPGGGWSCAAAERPSALPPRPVQETAPAATAAAAEPRRAESPRSGRASTVRSADYSHLDWVPREQLSSAQLAEIGPYCSGSYVEPRRPGQFDETPMSQAPTYVSAEASRYEQQTETATLAGDVVLRQGRIQAEANEARLNQLENRGELIGNVRLRDRGALLLGDRAELMLDTGEASIDNAEYILHEGQVRGSAQYIKREDTAIIRLKDGTYTRCEPGRNTWHLRGNNVTLDQARGFGSATNVTLRVKDIPVFYTPYIHFPLDDRRQSGFLMPGLSSSSRTGASLITPYYFNLAPNFDATLYPHYMSERGLLMEGEFRYLTRNSEGSISAAYLDDQEDERRLQSEYEDQRWMYSLQNHTGLDSRWLAELDYTDISDPYYFQDLDTHLRTSRPEFVTQRAALSYRGDTFTAGLNLHAYERATIVDITPYDRMPQLTLNGFLPVQPGGLRFDYAGEYVNFKRSLRSGDFINENGVPEQWYDDRLVGLNRAEGERLHLEPGVSLPMDWSWGYIKPSLRYAFTQYELDLDSRGQATLGDQTFNSSQNRGVPIASLDSGLYFDRDTQWFGNPYRQTLEPRLFYLYVPYEDQQDIPVFDSGEFAFSYAQLWRDNRFSGRDRIGDANQLSLGVTSRWIEPNGFERQTFSFGQALYFRDRRVQLPGIDYRERAGAQADVSPYALEYMYRYNRDWRFSSHFNWDPDTGTTISGSAMFHYQPADNPNKIVNLGYRYRNDTMRFDQASGTWTYNADFGVPGTPEYIQDYYKIQQHDFSTVWPVLQQWSLVARWQYDYAQNRTLEAFGGFEYDSCCWKVRLINRYWIDYDEVSLDPARNDEPDRGIFLQIVFKGLGNVVGSATDTFLDQGIQGYREREDQAY